MATKTIELTSGKWVLLFSGKNETPIFIEKHDDGWGVWLAIGNSEPEFSNSGHILRTGMIKCVELDEGENLYAFSSRGQIYTQPLKIVITE